MMIRSANPALSDSVFQEQVVTDSPMTIQGTVNKTGTLLILAFAASAVTWNSTIVTGGMSPLMWVGVIGGFIMALITVFKKESAGITAPIYAVCQGLFLGGISGFANAMYPGVAVQAIGLTFATLFCLLGAYKSGMIRATENFKLGIVAATGALGLFYLVTFILSFFGFHFTSIFGNGVIGIGFSLVVVTIAALNLVMDFDFIEHGAQIGAPKYMEWYGAFGLMVTLVWLYVEILRLLMKLRSRD